MAIRARPLAYGDIDLNGTNQYSSPVVPQRDNGYPDQAIPLAEEFNTLGQHWGGWGAHFDSTVLRTTTYLRDESRVSAAAFGYTPAAGLVHAVAADSAYIIDGHYVDLPITRLAFENLSPKTFTASRWTHFYLASDGTITVDVQPIATPAAPPVGTFLIGTGKTDATDLVAFDDADAVFSTRQTLSAVGITHPRMHLVDTVDGTTLFVESMSTLAPALYVTNYAGGAAIQADVGTSAAAAFAANVAAGAGKGISINLTGTLVGGSGVEIVADAATAGVPLRLTHAGSNAAIDVLHTGAAATAAVFAASGNNARAILAQGSGSGSAILAQAGATAASAINAAALTSSGFGVDATGGSGSANAHGLRGSGVHADAHGMHGRTSTSASSVAAGVFGEGRGTGTMGGLFTALAGIALVAQGDSSSPDNPAFRVVPQNTDPAFASSGGEMTSHSVMNQLRHGANTTYYGIYQGGGAGASACIFKRAAAGPFTANSTVNWTSVIGGGVGLSDAAGNGYYGIAVGAEVTVTITMDIRAQTAVATTLDLRVRDVTGAAVTIFERSSPGATLTDGFRLSVATTEWQRSISVSFQYAPPAEGDLNLEVDIKVGDAAANVEARDACLSIWGAVVP